MLSAAVVDPNASWGPGGRLAEAVWSEKASFARIHRWMILVKCCLLRKSTSLQ
jgi:hypothetical protein